MKDYYIKRNEEYLAHHGIKGQKWGIRRYQNEDGTFTEEGKKRYGINSNNKMSKEGSKLFNQDRVQFRNKLDEELTKKNLNPDYFKNSTFRNIARRSAAKKYIINNYGSLTLKEFEKSDNSKRRKALGHYITIGFVASLGAATIATLWDKYK